jgi:mRNA interferase RelE/StbE
MMMPKVESSQRFKDAYLNLPPEIQLKVKKALRLLAENLRHPSLQTKPLHGVKGIYEARLDQNCRITFDRLPGDILRMRTVGKHDEAQRNP